MVVGTRGDVAPAPPAGSFGPPARGEAWAVVGARRSGKTRQLELRKREAEAAGGRVGWAAAWPGADPPPLWHWRPVLAAIGHRVPPVGEPSVGAAAADLLTALAGGAYDVLVVDDVDDADDASRVLLEALLRQLPGLPVEVVVAGRDPSVVDALGIRAVGSTPATTPEVPPSPPRVSLRREAEWWSIRFAGREGILRPRKGLDQLRSLVERPGREMHVLELAGDQVRRAGTPALDGRAIAQCRREWHDLREDLDAAETMHDTARVAMLRERVDLLERSLSAALGRNGRPRLLGDATERARLNVTRAVRSAIAEIGRFDESLGRHLDGSVRTGTFCVYRPAAPLEWELRR